jgi:ABC-type bacteriocin/lantibiotic exporter with double-glycine peptidase domain/CRP-like cAMP-binding protein
MNDPLDALLRGSPLFRPLSEDAFAKLRARLRPEHHEFGEVIVRQGDAADAIFILVSGRVRVVKQNARGEELSLAVLRPGDAFGELALMARNERTATVRASTAVELLRLDGLEFRRLLKEQPELRNAFEATARYRVLHTFLCEYSNFGRLAPRVLHEVVARLVPAEFRMGETVFRKGDPPGPMFVVESGRVRIFEEAEGRQRNLAFYREGDFFGELSILNGSPRAATAEAFSDCRLLALRAEDVRHLEATFPDFSLLLGERLLEYQRGREARLPLDFAEPATPADHADGTALLSDEHRFPRKQPGRIRHMPHVRQIDEMDCGAACLAAICEHFGRSVSLARVRRLCEPASDGASLTMLRHAAAELGLSAQAIKASPRNLANLPLPAIVHYDGDHWVVLFDVSSSHARISDPASGQCRLSHAEFESRWSGHVLLVEPTEAFDAVPQRKAAGRALMLRVKEVWLALSGAFLLGAVARALVLFVVIAASAALDRPLLMAGAAPIFLIGAVVLAASFEAGRAHLLARAVQRLEATTFSAIARRLVALPISYFDTRSSADLARRLGGARELRTVLERGHSALLDLLSAAGTLLVLTFFSWGMSAAALACFLVAATTLIWRREAENPRWRVAPEDESACREQLDDVVRAIEVIKATGAESVASEMVAEIAGSDIRTATGSGRALPFSAAIAHGIPWVSAVAVLWVGLLQLRAGQLTIATVAGCAALAGIGCAAAHRAIARWRQAPNVRELLDRLEDIFETECENDATGAKPVPTLSGEIGLRDVDVRSRGTLERSALRCVSLNVTPGKCIAIVGASGSGKSTLARVLSGLLEPTGGLVLFDRMDAASLRRQDLRAQIGFVPQEPWIFEGTVERNLAPGDAEPGAEQIRRCIEFAGLGPFIARLPRQLDTRINGETARRWPKEAVARLLLARALYRDPPILIVDEAAGGLDAENARSFHDTVRDLRSGRTCVIFATRPDSIRDADEILVLEQGEIVERGTHETLLERRGNYSRMWERQSVR